MPRIAASVLCLVLVVAALWWNIVSHPVVWQMLAPKDHEQPPDGAAVAAEQLKPQPGRDAAAQLKPQPGRDAAAQPKTARPHISANQPETEKPQTPVLALSTNASAQPTVGTDPAPKVNPSDGALPGGQSATGVVTENAERRYPPEPFLAEAALPSLANGCKDDCCPIKPQFGAGVAGSSGARQTSGAPLQWLPLDKQQGSSTSASQQQATQPSAKPSGKSLPAVVAGFSRVTQEATGPVPIQPALHPGALVPVSRETECSDSSAFQVRRLPPVEDQEQPSALAATAAGEMPTTYPSTGIE